MYEFFNYQLRIPQKTPVCFFIITHNFVPLQAKNKI